MVYDRVHVLGELSWCKQINDRELMTTCAVVLDCFSDPHLCRSQCCVILYHMLNLLNFDTNHFFAKLQTVLRNSFVFHWLV